MSLNSGSANMIHQEQTSFPNEHNARQGHEGKTHVTDCAMATAPQLIGLPLS